MILDWIIAIGLILVNSVYVAGEFATVAARPTFIKKLAQGGDKLAGKLLAVLETPRSLDEYIATCQIGITLSSLVLGAFSEIAFAHLWADALEKFGGLDKPTATSAATLGILTLFTLLQILIGELLPKSVSLQYADKVALFMYWPMRISSIVLRPFIVILNGSGNALMRMLNIPPASHKHIHSLDEIELLLAESKDGGLLEPEEHERLHQALELSDKTVKQLMTPRTKIQAVSEKASLEECYKIALTCPYTRLLVYGETIDEVLGITNVEHVIQAKLTEQDTSISKLVRPVPVVPENLPMGSLLTLLKERHSHVAVVMDEHGATRGIVTVGDILSELIEDVDADEFKRPETIEILKDGGVKIPGTYKLHKAAKFLGKIPGSDAETVNGLIVEMLERVPEEGDVLQLPESTITVVEVELNAAVSVLIKRKENE